jgi:hypothetical protein
MKITEFIKLRRLLWAGHVIRMEKHCIPQKALQQTVNCERQVEKQRKRWEHGERKDDVMLLGIRAWKTETKDRESWRQRIEEAKALYGL